VQNQDITRRLASAGAVLLAVLLMPLPGRAEPQVVRAACDIPSDLIRLVHPLTRVSERLKDGLPVTIVAIGSSSTAGAGASSPAATYPSRLAVELRRQFPDRAIKVVNRGIGGEEIADMLGRFDRAVIALKPDLVLWQLGTNSVIRNHKLAGDGALIDEGLARIRAIGADVVLIDPQYAPRVIKRPQAERMVELIATTAKGQDVDLFPRFRLMRRWHQHDHIGFDTFVSRDGLHMNDWSYACMAKGLSLAIAEAVNRPVVSAKTSMHVGR
jgi:lysophospholipase L1-like esterase